MKNIDPLSPLGQLLIEKREVEELCHERERRLIEDWHYIRDNAGHLLFSELKSLFFRIRREYGRKGEGTGIKPGGGGELAATAWQFLRPMVYRWAAGMGWRMVRDMFVRKPKE